MRPVSTAFRISQPFGSMKTAGVVANSNPASGAGYYVYLYGNYQPYGHAGCDIACPEGTPVFAIAAGTVLWADWGTNLPGDESNAGYRKRWYLYKKFPGIVTIIQHAGWVGVYAHLSRAQMSAGDRVTEGKQIGLSGGTGGVAPHLHVEALVDLNYTTGGGLIYGRTNPEPFFKSAGEFAAQGTVTPQASEEDDVSAQEVLSWPIDRTDGQKSTVAIEFARLGPDLAAVKSMLERIAPEVNESMINDRKQVYGIEALAAQIATLPASEIAAQIDAAGQAAAVLAALVELLKK